MLAWTLYVRVFKSLHGWKIVKDLNAKIFFPNLLGIVDIFIFQLILSNLFEHKDFL